MPVAATVISPPSCKSSEAWLLLGIDVFELWGPTQIWERGNCSQYRPVNVDSHFENLLEDSKLKRGGLEFHGMGIMAPMVPVLPMPYARVYVNNLCYSCC